jgi:hypothetical protein
MPGHMDDLTFTVPGVPGDLVTTTFTWTIRQAAYNNEFGIYRVDDWSGQVGPYRPGDIGYPQAALAPENSIVIFRSGQGAGATTSVTLTAGATYGAFIIQDSTLANFRANNPTNSINRRPLAFFSFPTANPDNQFDHLRTFVRPDGRTEFFWEDMTYGGDRDFTDVVYVIDMQLLMGTHRTYVYPTVAIDPDDDVLAFELLKSPPHTTINPKTGLLSWLTAIGEFDFTIRVSDGRGGSDEQSFTILVDESPLSSIRGTKFHDTRTSLEDEFPQTSTGLPGWIMYLDTNLDGQRDESEPFVVTDAEGNYVFTGLTAGEYVVREEPRPGWTQTAPLQGSHRVVVASGQVADNLDFWNAETDETLHNVPPLFRTIAPSSAIVGQLLQYGAEAIDANGDPLTFDLPLAPTGMTVHPERGVLVWQPTRDQVGSHQVVLRVRDDHGGVDLQSFTITVAAPNSPPVITSSPPSIAVVDLPLQYQVRAQDAEAIGSRSAWKTSPRGWSSTRRRAC